MEAVIVSDLTVKQEVSWSKNVPAFPVILQQPSGLRQLGRIMVAESWWRKKGLQNRDGGLIFTPPTETLKGSDIERQQ